MRTPDEVPTTSTGLLDWRSRMLRVVVGNCAGAGGRRPRSALELHLKQAELAYEHDQTASRKLFLLALERAGNDARLRVDALGWLAGGFWASEPEEVLGVRGGGGASLRTESATLPCSRSR